MADVEAALALALGAGVADVPDEGLRDALRALAAEVLPRLARDAVPASLAPSLRAMAAFAAEPSLDEAPDGPFGALVAALALDPVEARLAAAALSTAVDVRFHRLWQLHARRDDVAGPTVGALARLLDDGERPDEVLAILRRDHVLRALGLVELDGRGDRDPLGQVLVATPALAGYALGGRWDERADGVTATAATATLHDALPAGVPVERFAAGLRGAFASSSTRARASDPPPVALCLHGPAGSGRGHLAEAVAALLGLDLAVGTLGDEPERVVASLLRAALLGGALPCLVVPDERRPLLAAALARVASVHRGPLAIVSDARAPLPSPWSCLAVETALPDAAQRARLWRLALGDAGDAALVDGVARRFPLGREAIFRAGANALVAAGAHGRACDDDTLAAAAREELARSSPLAELITPRRRIEDLVASDDVLDAVEEIILFVRYRDDVARAGFSGERGWRTGVRALFSGPPGTGKSLTAEIVAGELGLDILRIDLSAVVSKWIGETEKNLAQVFSQAEATGCVLLFDEADALFAKRSADVRSAVDRYANLEVNYLLQRIEAFSGIVLLTSNFESAIDEAFRRRLNFRVRFAIPDAAEREALWRNFLPPDARVDADVQFAELASRFDMSGGHIRNAVLRAAFLAARESAPLAMRHFATAALREFSEIGRVTDEQ